MNFFQTGLTRHNACDETLNSRRLLCHDSSSMSIPEGEESTFAIVVHVPTVENFR
jgi:hypothetical protein